MEESQVEPHAADGAIALDEQRFAVTRETAARIAGLSPRQLSYWASTGLVEPGVSAQVSAARHVRLYRFVDVLALLVAIELKDRGVSLQHTRSVVEHLRSRGYQTPLTQLRFATVNGRLYFMHSDGSWEDGLHPDQVVIHEVLNLAPLRRKVAEGVKRDTKLTGHVERRRGALGGKPVIAGTRVPLATVQRYLAAGRSPAEIAKSFPVLTVADVEAVARDVA